MGDQRTYEEVIALRAVTTEDFMTADWARLPYDLLAKVANRIVNEVQGLTGWSMTLPASRRERSSGSRGEQTRNPVGRGSVPAIETFRRL